MEEEFLDTASQYGDVDEEFLDTASQCGDFAPPLEFYGAQ